MFFEEPFTTYPGCEFDPKFDSPEEETQEYIDRENVIWDFLHGRTGCIEVYDALDEHGIDVYKYMDSVEDNINFIMANGIQPVDSVLWLPNY
ncbi:MAG: hypothetical protein ACOVQ7_15480 [Limnoraphis robusta]|jgi:hypothetical protein